MKVETFVSSHSYEKCLKGVHFVDCKSVSNVKAKVGFKSRSCLSYLCYNYSCSISVTGLAEIFFFFVPYGITRNFRTHLLPS